MPAEGASSWSWACVCCGRRRRKTGDAVHDDDGAGASSLFIDLPVLEAATAGFSDGNLLGRGGFGPVYRGVLASGQEIAVKRLSLESRQGAREFLNEVRLLLKVQHRNLVSLLGCCAASGPPGHKMLVYPYFPNGSLDHFLFGLGMAASTRPWKCCDRSICALTYPPICFCTDKVERCDDACKNCEQDEYSDLYYCRDQYQGIDQGPKCTNGATVGQLRHTSTYVSP